MRNTQIPVIFKLLALAACFSVLGACAMVGMTCPDDDITCFEGTDLGFGPNSEDYDRVDRFDRGEPGESDESPGVADPGDTTSPGDTTGSDDSTSEL